MRRLALLVISLSVISLMVGTVFASGGTKACVPAKEGKAIVTAKEGACKSGYTLTEIGAEGKGPTGPAGAKGETGATGATGPEGKEGKAAGPPPLDVTFFKNARSTSALTSPVLESAKYDRITVSTKGINASTLILEVSDDQEEWFAQTALSLDDTWTDEVGGKYYRLVVTPNPGTTLEISAIAHLTG